MQNSFLKVRCTLLIILMLTAIGSLSAQGTISGIVANVWGQPLSRVSVELFTDDGSSRLDDEKATLIAATRTDTMGHYLIESIPSGQYAVRFNHKDDTTYKTITFVRCGISDTNLLLDVHLEPMCILGEGSIIGPSRVLNQCHIKVRCYRKSRNMAKVEFETLKDKERSTLYTKSRVSQFFPDGTGRVRIRIYDHVGKDQWQLRKTMVRRPRKER